MSVESRLETWLKIAANNKINIKNTWEVPIIEHFSNIEEFRETRGINFLKVTNTLDGCVKVYSARVDNVISDTFKLLDSLSSESTVADSKQRKRKGINTLEGNLCNLNLKDLTKQSTFFEPIFLKYKEYTSVFNLARINNSGFLSLVEQKPCEYLNLAHYSVDVSNMITENHICPTLNELNPDISQKIFEIDTFGEEKHVYEAKPFKKTYQPRETQESFDMVDYNEAELQKRQDIEVSVFGYNKSWNDPENWKMIDLNKTGKKSYKKKNKSIIDFSGTFNTDMVYDMGDNLIKTKKVIERRKNPQMLEEESEFKKEHLYKFMNIEGVFSNQDLEDLPIEEKINELSIHEEVPNQSLGMDYSLEEEVHMDLKNIRNPRIINNLLLKYKKSSKKIDIKQLQQKVMMSVEEHKVASLRTICSEVPMMYEKEESKAISVHYCILSLLFLAHENNLEINGLGLNLSVKKNFQI